MDSGSERTMPSSSSREVTFTALSSEFHISNGVRDLFLTGPMESLEDFSRYFRNEKDIWEVVAADGSLNDEELEVQISRVKKAWTTARDRTSDRVMRVGSKPRPSASPYAGYQNVAESKSGSSGRSSKRKVWQLSQS